VTEKKRKENEGVLIPLVCSKKRYRTANEVVTLVCPFVVCILVRGERTARCVVQTSDHTAPFDITLLRTKRRGAPFLIGERRRRGWCASCTPPCCHCKAAVVEEGSTGRHVGYMLPQLMLLEREGGEIPPCTAPPLLLASLSSRCLPRPKPRAWSATWPA
jgi:hypothetical protein